MNQPAFIGLSHGPPDAGADPRPKILFVMEDLLVGGAQRHSIGLTKKLGDRFDFRILGLSAGRSQFDVAPALEPNSRLLGLTGVIKPSSFRRIADALDEEAPALIVAVNQVATVAVSAALRLARRKPPLAVIFHTTDVTNMAGWVRTTPFFPAVWAANALVYVSANQQRLWMRRGLRSRRVELIRNGIDLTRYAPADPRERRAMREYLGLADDDYVIGLSAVFRHEKNHGQLIEAVAALRAQGIAARALLLGDGPKRPEIEQRAREMGVSEHVILAGMQSDVRPYIAAVDVGVNCSTSTWPWADR
jgi:glycosyltransferase involved in cell wall biosynthesis